MRERTIPVSTEKLIAARGEWRRPADVVRRLNETHPEFNMTRQKLWNYENGRHDVPEPILRALCALYRVSMSSLMPENFLEKVSTTG
jgi:transcriptional regulator with XRE-family HTH domain